MAEKEEREAIVAEQDASIEVEEAEIARLKFVKEKAEADEAMAVAEKELADVHRAESDLKDAETDLEVAKATNNATEVAEATERVNEMQEALEQERKEAEDAKAKAVKEKAEAEEAEANAEREMAEATAAKAIAARERGEAEDAKAIAAREQQEAVEARSIAERELAEMLEAREVAERERAEAEEAREVAEKERAEADAAKAEALQVRKEFNANKEAWAQRKAMENAMVWKRRAKKVTKKKKIVARDTRPPPSVVNQMLSGVVGSLRRFESEYKAERASGDADQAAAQHERALRLQQLRREYSDSMRAHQADRLGLPLPPLGRQSARAPPGGHRGPQHPRQQQQWRPASGKQRHERSVIAAYGLSPRQRRQLGHAADRIPVHHSPRGRLPAPPPGPRDGLPPMAIREVALMVAFERAELRG